MYKIDDCKLKEETKSKLLINSHNDPQSCKPVFASPRKLYHNHRLKPAYKCFKNESN